MLLLVWWILFMVLISLLPFFFSSRRRHTRCLSDWSSDVCSSDLELRAISRRRGAGHRGLHHPSRRTSETLVTDTVRRTQLSLPGPRSKALFDAEAMYLAPGTQSVALFSQLSIDRGEGALLYDVDGNRYVDLLARVGVARIGYPHPKYVAAMQRE